MMKSLYSLLVIAITISSCTITKSTCQYFETSSSNVSDTIVNGKHIYSYEDSLVIVNYNLWASGGQVAFSIYNKSNDPIYVNWKNSNFIYLGYNYEYWSDEITAQTYSTTSGNETKRSNSSTVTDIYRNNYSEAIVVTGEDYKSVSNFATLTNEVSTVRRENPSIQIPPKSYNVIHKFNLDFPLIREGKSEITFDKNDSPLHFRNYLAISKDKNFEEQIFIDNDFWISSFQIKTSSDEDYKCDSQYKPNPNAFYIYHKTTKPDRKKALVGTLIAFGAAVGVLTLRILL